MTIASRVVMFADGELVEIEQQDIRVNGLAFGGGRVPRLPIIEPERVASVPLAIELTDVYRYALAGTQTMEGTLCYVVRFAPAAGGRTLFRGTAWIAADDFGLVKVAATQVGLRGPIVSSDQVDTFARVDGVWLLRESRVNQIYEGAAHRTPIERVMTLDRTDADPVNFESRRASVYASPNVMVRDTPQGYRYLRRGDPDERREPLAVPAIALERPATRVRTVALGMIADPNISHPLPFACLSYVDFDLLGTGTQFNGFFGGRSARWRSPCLRSRAAAGRSPGARSQSHRPSTIVRSMEALSGTKRTSGSVPRRLRCGRCAADAALTLRVAYDSNTFTTARRHHRTGVRRAGVSRSTRRASRSKGSGMDGPLARGGHRPSASAGGCGETPRRPLRSRASRLPALWRVAGALHGRDAGARRARRDRLARRPPPRSIQPLFVRRVRQSPARLSRRAHPLRSRRDRPRRDWVVAAARLRIDGFADAAFVRDPGSIRASGRTPGSAWPSSHRRRSARSSPRNGATASRAGAPTAAAARTSSGSAPTRSSKAGRSSVLSIPRVTMLVLRPTWRDASCSQLRRFSAHRAASSVAPDRLAGIRESSSALAFERYRKSGSGRAFASDTSCEPRFGGRVSVQAAGHVA